MARVQLAELAASPTSHEEESDEREVGEGAPVRCADLLVDVLERAGVDVVYGVPGGAISPIYDALVDHPRIRVVHARHETSAIFMAIGHTRVRPDALPCILLTSGPGVTNAVTGLAAVLSEGVPAIVIGGEVPRSKFGHRALQEGSPETKMAASLLAGGGARRALVVVSTSNSVQVLDDDTIGWFVGDGAGAFVVERSGSDSDAGVVGWKTINSVGTNDMFVIRSVPSGDGGTRLCTVADESAGAMARDTAEPYLRACVDGALTMASMSVADVDFWIFNTPNAWYADFCARALGVAEDRYHSVYPRYANIGAVLMPAALYHALDEGRIRPGDAIGMYSVGSSSTASALILRVGQVALGPYPERPASAQ